MKYTKFNASTVIRSILKRKEEIIKLVPEQNIKPLVAPKNTEGNIIVCERDEYSKDYTKMGITNEECKVYVTAISSDYDESVELAELINDTLEGSFPEYGLSIKMLDSTEDYQADKYFQTLLFKLGKL